MLVHRRKMKKERFYCVFLENFITMSRSFSYWVSFLNLFTFSNNVLVLHLTSFIYCCLCCSTQSVLPILANLQFSWCFPIIFFFPSIWLVCGYRKQMWGIDGLFPLSFCGLLDRFSPGGLAYWDSGSLASFLFLNVLRVYCFTAFTEKENFPSCYPIGFCPNCCMLRITLFCLAPICFWMTSQFSVLGCSLIRKLPFLLSCRFLAQIAACYRWFCFDYIFGHLHDWIFYTCRRSWNSLKRWRRPQLHPRSKNGKISRVLIDFLSNIYFYCYRFTSWSL